MKILYAGNSDQDKARIISAIQRTFPNADIIDVSNLAQARRAYDINKPDIVITRDQYPNDVERKEAVSGQLLAEYVRRQDPKKPIIVTYGSLDSFEEFTINSEMSLLPESGSLQTVILARLREVKKVLAQRSPG